MTKSEEFCKNNPDWIRIADVEDSDCFYLQYENLKKTDQKSWRSKEYYDEYAIKKCKVPYGFIGEQDGKFYVDIPFCQLGMMIFRVGKKNVTKYVKRLNAA